MSEEEKEEYENAIANGKSIIKVFEFCEGSIAYYEIYSMINLIEKQQKEIEDLKSDRDYYKEMYYKIAFPEDEITVKGLGVD